VTRRSCSRPTCATGCPPTTSPGSSWTWSTSSTWDRSCAYRADGHGRTAYDPKTLLGVLLYAYATGVRSSRQIQRRCVEDLAFRVLAANQTPDHVTIARFRARHEAALAGFLVASLKLCAAAERQQRYAQRVAAATAAARAKGKPPRQLKPRPRDEAPNPKATANVTDPDSRFLHTRKGSVQGYNAQAVTTEHQLRRGR
jgi:hypothetical protein